MYIIYTTVYFIWFESKSEDIWSEKQLQYSHNLILNTGICQIKNLDSVFG